MADPTSLPMAVGGDAGGVVHRLAGGADHARARGDPPGAGPEVELGGQGDRRGDGGRPQGAGRRGPPALRDAHYSGAGSLGHGVGYQYAHDAPNSVAAQQYAPDAVHGRQYYEPTRRGAEARYSDVYDRVRALLAGEDPVPAAARPADRAPGRAPDLTPSPDAAAAPAGPATSDAAQPDPDAVP